MNPGQKQFYDFFMERTKDGKKEEAKALLENGFARHEAFCQVLFLFMDAI